LGFPPHSLLFVAVHGEAGTIIGGRGIKSLPLCSGLNMRLAFLFLQAFCVLIEFLFSFYFRCKSLDCLAVVECLRVKLQNEESQVVLVRTRVLILHIPDCPCPLRGKNSFFGLRRRDTFPLGYNTIGLNLFCPGSLWEGSISIWSVTL